MRIYIAGPYTKNNIAQNVKEACEIANDIFNEFGLIPFVPHLTHFWHMMFPQSWETWMDYDKEWLKVCNVLYRLPGESKGADIEEEFARGLGIPIVHDFYELEKLL